MMRIIKFLVLWLSFWCSPVLSQDIYFHPVGEKYAHGLTREITYEQEISRIDSVSQIILADTTSMERFDSLRYSYYWKNDTLKCAVYYWKDDSNVNRSEWVFENNHAIRFKQTVRYLKDGKYFTKDRHYFSPYYNGNVPQYMMFAWIHFNKRVAISSAAFELRNSSLPFQGQEVQARARVRSGK
jgi:hypothetical protein